jgi:DNA-binding MarR family transcriptional regulator
MAEIDARFRAWYATAQMALRSLEVIEREVETATGVPVAWLEVLAFLERSDDGRRRMSELADQSLLSRGGATRMVTRMEESELVIRESPPEDRRATYAVITPQGLATLERVRPVHRAAVARYFTAAIDDAEAEALRDISLRVLELVGTRCEWLLRDLAVDEAR